MRALAIAGFGDLEDLQEVDVAEPTGAGVRVRVRAAALNPADVKVITGKDGGRFLHSSRFPLVPGFDFSGVVVESAGNFITGDEVYGHLPYSRSNRQGTLAEAVLVPATAIAKKPTQLSHAQAAAAATVGLTALHALRNKGRIREGMRVLINGASGGVGSLAIQLAKHDGAEVVATCSESKRDFVANLGADQVVDYRSQSIIELAPAFDIVFDCAATLSMWKCRPILRRGGTYITLLPNISLVTGMMFGWAVARRCRALIVKSTTKGLDDLSSLLASGDVRAPVESIVPWNRDLVVDALTRLRTGRVCGKIAIEGPPESP